MNWLATMIVRGCGDVSSVFEAIERSGYLGPVDNEDLEKYEHLQIISLGKSIKCEPLDYVETKCLTRILRLVTACCMDLETKWMKYRSEERSVNATMVSKTSREFGRTSSIFLTSDCQLIGHKHNISIQTRDSAHPWRGCKTDPAGNH